MVKSTARTERRRKRAEMESKMEDEFQKTIENVEYELEPSLEQGSENKLVRRNTYILSKSKSQCYLNPVKIDQEEDKSTGEESNSLKSENFTYNVNVKSEESELKTFKIENNAFTRRVTHTGTYEIRPIPAPRRRKPFQKSPEKVSSDTDKDIMEIDLDDVQVKSDVDAKSTNSSKPSSRSLLSKGSTKNSTPIPKPRKLLPSPNEAAKTYLPVPILRKSKSFEDLAKETFMEDDRNIKSESHVLKVNAQQEGDSARTRNELPLLENLKYEYAFKSEKEIQDTVKKNKKLKIMDLVDRKKKKKKKPSKMFSSIKLEKTKISSILKGGKEAKPKDEKVDEEDSPGDFQVESPKYPKSAQIGHIYVQNKYGFHVMEKEEVLTKDKLGRKDDEGDRMVNDKTVRTAILFQRYWSRSMLYLHGILAGFGFSHAATVATIMLHYNYNASDFISVYSCLSLKIHFIFYTLTAFCIVSCFDRLDLGHINKKHCEVACKLPGMWIILSLYIISFALTFSNQKIESSFDAYLYGNDTEENIWGTQEKNDIQLYLLTWYHTIWARDTLLVIVWLIIALTNFKDFLEIHLTNMMKYINFRGDDKSFQDLSKKIWTS